LAVYETRGAYTAITIVMLWRLRAVNGEREWRRAHEPQRLPFTRQALKTFHGRVSLFIATAARDSPGDHVGNDQHENY